jgi:hypothetical protein
VVQGSGRPPQNRTQFAGRGGGGGGGGWAAPPPAMSKPAFAGQPRPKLPIEGAADPECWFYKDAMGAVSSFFL